ncbi:MAG: creatininase family protein [Burkholderiaceae bacterium]
MPQSKPQYWSQLRTTDFADLDPVRTIAVLPVSACEQHGPHLPLGTDAIINEGVVTRMLASLSPNTRAVVLPAQVIGDSIEHTAFAGTLTADFDALVKLWVAIGAGVRRAGLNKMIIFNTHGGQRGHVDQAAVRLRVEHSMLVARVNGGGLGMPENLFSAQEKRFGLHGGEIETSMIMALAPELIRMESVANFVSRDESLSAASQLLAAEKPIGFGWMTQDLNTAGVLGNASAATAEKGEQQLDHMASQLAAVCEDLANAPNDLLVNSSASG